MSLLEEPIRVGENEEHVAELVEIDRYGSNWLLCVATGIGALASVHVAFEMIAAELQELDIEGSGQCVETLENLLVHHTTRNCAEDERVLVELSERGIQAAAASDLRPRLGSVSENSARSE